ncbi:MAG: trehalose-phosphatase, partial [Thermodesulfobacteriota bacterium]|nr:trehalose-phosphatase [Thermodesulfobacteriota bacterium]
QKRLFLLDYDGTLVPFVAHPHMAKPPKKLLNILKNLSEDENNEIFLVSGRDKETIHKWFNTLNIGLVAEHGVWIKERNDEWRLLKSLPNDWKPQIIPILERYANQLLGSFVEEKDFSIVWHYRMADPEMCSIRAKELRDELVNFTANIDVQVLKGSKTVEVRNSGINKGIAATYIIAKNNYDFILAIGDDRTDEDLFKALPETAYSIRVGMTQSIARFNLNGQQKVIKLLEDLTNNKHNQYFQNSK